MILPHHLEDLRKSGLTDSTITDAGIRSGDQNEVQDILGMKVRCTGGLIFPFWQLNGEPLKERIIERGGHSWERHFCRVKPDYLSEHGAAKYLSPQGSTNHLYIIPGQEKLLMDPTIPLYPVEGEKKSAALLQFGFCSLGLSGTWGWRTKGSGYQSGGGTILPEFDAIPLNKRKIFIIFDSDTSTNRLNQIALKQFAMTLRRHGAIAIPVVMPELETVSTI